MVRTSQARGSIQASIISMRVPPKPLGTATASLLLLALVGACSRFTMDSDSKCQASSRLRLLPGAAKPLLTPLPTSGFALQSTTPDPDEVLSLTAGRFATCQEVQEHAREMIAQRLWYDNWQGNGGDIGGSDEPDCGVKTAAQSGGVMPGPPAESVDNMTGNAADTPAAAEPSFTNVQELGVDEADFIKIGVHQIFVLRGDGIEVINRPDLKPLGRLELPGLVDVTLYATGDRLVAVGNSGRVNPALAWNGYGGYTPPDLTSNTQVLVYSVTAGAMPEPLGAISLDGAHIDSRVVSGRLFLVYKESLPIDPALLRDGRFPFRTREEIPSDVLLVKEGRINGVRCDDVSRPLFGDFDIRYTKVASLSLKDPTETPRFTAAVGGGDHTYMTADTLYLTKEGYLPAGPAGGADNDAQEARAQAAPTEIVAVTRIDLDRETGEMTVAAAGGVTGRIKDQWALKEYRAGDDKVLALMTTTGQLWSHGADMAQNHLWVLKRSETALVKAAAIHDFGTGEDIRAVRYAGSMAYAVTFKKTDPLFAFDMRDPLAPELLGELIIPGFSTYLHPVADGRLAGIGFDAADQGDFAFYQGIQVSLFDVSDPRRMARLDNHVLGERGSYSEITSDHHAFFHDRASGLLGVPVVELGRRGPADDWSVANGYEFSGAVLYQVTEDRLREVTRVSHGEMIPERCRRLLTQGRWWQDEGASLDINRIFRVDDRLLTVSRFGIKALDPAAPATVTATVEFVRAEPVLDQLCPAAPRWESGD